MITIITPCSREGNLRKIEDSILTGTSTEKVNWMIVQDLERSTIRPLFPVQRWIECLNISGGVSGNLQRNYALDNLSTKGWLYFLDDDNLLHHDFYRVISQAKLDFPDALAFTFSQELPDGSVRLGNDIRVCHIDQAQFIVHTDLIGTLRYEQKYEADGIFIETLYKAHPDKFVVLPNVISYYNKLR